MNASDRYLTYIRAAFHLSDLDALHRQEGMRNQYREGG